MKWLERKIVKTSEYRDREGLSEKDSDSAENNPKSRQMESHKIKKLLCNKGHNL